MPSSLNGLWVHGLDVLRKARSLVTERKAVFAGIQAYAREDYHSAMKTLLPVAERGHPKAEYYCGLANY